MYGPEVKEKMNKTIKYIFFKLHFNYYIFIILFFS